MGRNAILLLINLNRMKTFYLIRHAKSSWEDPTLDDFDRPLNNRGLRDGPIMSQMLKGKGVKVDRILSSPANRAYTTSKYFAEALDIDVSDIVLHPEIYEAYPEHVIQIIRGLDDSLNTVLLFGHNPSFTSLANMFTDDYIANVATCGVVRIESSADEWSGIDRANTKVAEYLFPKLYV